MRIAFANMWDGFDIHDNFITHMCPDFRVVENPYEAQWIFFSHWGTTLPYPKEKLIHYSGERYTCRDMNTNTEYALSLTHDKESETNIRFPVWYLYKDWYRRYPPVEIHEGPKKFCCAVYSNHTPLRDEFIKKLSEYKNVDCYGNGHPLQIPKETVMSRNKIRVISEYKFNICFENFSKPGYYTEKLPDSKLAGCVPLYWGDIGVDTDFNPYCHLNLATYKTVEEFVERIIELDKSDYLYNKIQQVPVFYDDRGTRETYERACDRLIKFMRK